MESEGLQRGEVQEAKSSSLIDTNRRPEETATVHGTIAVYLYSCYQLKQGVTFE